MSILTALVSTLIESTTALLPLLLFFAAFQIFVVKLPRTYIVRVAAGLLFTIAGLTMFLAGVHIGFMPVGHQLGQALADITHQWLLIPIGFFLGLVAAYAEPAVRVLGYEVEKSSSGYIPGKLIIYLLSAGVGLIVALAMARLVYGLPFLWLVIPGYALIILLLRISSQSFATIAFDAGGVATGPMVVTFIMAIALGAASALEDRDPVMDGFGLIALVAMAPIIAILILGLIYNRLEGDK